MPDETTNAVADDMSRPLSNLDRARGVYLLLDLNEDLEALRAFAAGRPRLEGLRPPPSWVHEVAPSDPAGTPRQWLQRWAALFEKELAVVRAARNSAAHALALRDDDLVSAVQVAGKLLLHARLHATVGDADAGVRIADPRIAEALQFPRSAAPSDSAS